MMTQPFPFIDAQQLAHKLPMSSAIAAMRAALADDVENPPRVLLGTSLFMPGRVQHFTGVKVVSTIVGQPTGSVTVYGPKGDIIGMVDGAPLTLLRTGALAGLATHLLARPEAQTLAILGAGAVAPQQVHAVCAVRPIREIIVWGRTSVRAGALAAMLQELYPRCRVRCDDHADAAVNAADIVSCATPATAPLFAAASVRPGTHINAVGAYTPSMVEVPAACVQGARVFVEERAAASREAGDLIQAQCTPDGTIGDLLAQRTPGRRSVDDITLFKSVGLASADIAAAVVALLGSEALHLGQR